MAPRRPDSSDVDEPTTTPVRTDLEPRSGVQASVNDDLDFDDETMVEMNAGPPMADEPANVLSPDYPAIDSYGRYDILGRLAVGGMAEVFLAREMAGHGAIRHIAVKRILPQIADDDTFVEMFLDEARLAMRLNHPNICHIYDIGELDDSYYIAMEWVNGVPFGKLIAKARQAGTVLPVTIAVKVMAHVADALNYAHQARDGVGRPLNIVHRDCSPQNIMVRYDGVVKLLDFGIAKAATQTTKTEAGIVKGKFSYMSPEQCLGKPLDARSDIFAIGACLYEGLTGKPAFRRASDLDTMRAIVHEPVPSARLVRSDVPPRLDAILRRALAKDPTQRFQTAGELYIALERFLAEQGEFVHAMHIGAAIEKLMPDAAAAGPFAPSSSASGRALSLPESGSRPTAEAASGSGDDGVFDRASEPGSDLDTIDSRLSEKDAAAMLDGGIEVDLDDDFEEDFDGQLEDEDLPTEQWAGDDLPPAIKHLHEMAEKRRAAEAADDAPTTPKVAGGDAAGVPSNYDDPTEMLGKRPGAATSGPHSDTFVPDEPRGPSMLVRVGVLLAALVAAGVVTAGLLWALSDRDPADDGAALDPGAQGNQGTDEAATGTDTADTSGSPGAATGDPSGSEGPSETDTGETVTAVPTTGAVEVTSEPPGATVHLGDLEATTPVTWEEVAAGTHSVTATLEGHEETTEEIEVEAGETARLTLQLSAAAAALPGEGQAPAAAVKRPPARPLGLLVLDTDPRGTRVFYGRTPLGRTPLRARLPVGTVRLRLTTPDGSSHVRSVRINPRGQSRAFLPLSH